MLDGVLVRKRSTFDKIFVDYEISQDYEPQLLFRNLSANEDELVTLKCGDKIAWRMFPRKYCIGFHSQDEYHHYEPCPETKKLEIGTQCGRCKGADVLFPCLVCDGSKCHAIERIKEICDITPTSVYITLFDNYFKVGVSKKDRLFKRWLEQGADFAAEIATIPNGMLAREIESKLSQVFEISKTVRFSRKIRNLGGTNDKSTAGKRENNITEFGRSLRAISDWVSGNYGSDCAVREPLVCDLSSYYTLRSDGKATRINESKIETLAGSFRGMKGSILSINDNGADFLFDVREFRGRASQFGDSSADGMTLNNQKSITQYFS